MTNRPSFDEIYLSMAGLLAKRSTCVRLSVGCVVASTDFRQVYAVGYNGNATGRHNGCDSDEPGKCGCLHAEENAIINCSTPRASEKIVYCTHLPCVMCAKRLVNLGGVVRVVYERDYRIRDGADVLSADGIQLEQFGWSGEVKGSDHE